MSRIIPTVPTYNTTYPAAQYRSSIALGTLLVHDTDTIEFFEYFKTSSTPQSSVSKFIMKGWEKEDLSLDACVIRPRGVSRRLVYKVVVQPYLRNIVTPQSYAQFIGDINTVREKSYALEPLDTTYTPSISSKFGVYGGECDYGARIAHPFAFIRGYLCDIGFNGVIEQGSVVTLWDTPAVPVSHILTLHSVDRPSIAYTQIHNYISQYTFSGTSTPREFYTQSRLQYPSLNGRAPPLSTLKELYMSPSLRVKI